ncbi:MAG: hypothetical protein AB7T49_17240 [Oligoflexales bacterium]
MSYSSQNRDPEQRRNDRHPAVRKIPAPTRNLDRTKNEVRKIIVGWEPKSDVGDSIRHIRTSATKNKNANQIVEQNTAPGTNPFVTGDNIDLFFQDRSDVNPIQSKEQVTPLSSERTCLRFSINLETEEKLKRAQEILGAQRLEEVFDRALEALLEKKDPKRRQEKRSKQAEKKQTPIKEAPTTAKVAKTVTPRHKDEL